MAGALDKLEYTKVAGPRKTHNLKLYALSTCGFCKKAMRFLEDNGHEFEYIYLDLIDLELKREAKRELKSRHESIPVFPILTIDETDAISGFVEQKWTERLDTK